MLHRSLLVAFTLGACAAPRPVVDCQCISRPVEKAVIEGEFLVSVDAIVVESGDYVPPPAPPSVPTPVTLTINEQSIDGTYGAATISIYVLGHLQLVQTPGSSGGCCSPESDGISLDYTPRPWNERNAVRTSWSYDRGDVLADIDPTVVTVAAPTFPTLELAGLHAPFTPDPDGLGFVTNACFEVIEPGCVTDDCTSVIRVERHFRRPE